MMGELEHFTLVTGLSNLQYDRYHYRGQVRTCTASGTVALYAKWTAVENTPTPEARMASPDLEGETR